MQSFEFEAGDFVRPFYKNRKGPLCRVITHYGLGGRNGTLVIEILHSGCETTAPASWFRPVTALEALGLATHE